jgi:hypothetical protein
LKLSIRCFIHAVASPAVFSHHATSSALEAVATTSRSPSPSTSTAIAR